MHDNPILKTAVLSGILTILILVTHEIIRPLEQMVFGEVFQSAMLVYLPLGYWVIVAYYERWMSAVYLAPGLALGLALYGSPGVGLVTHAASLTVLATTAPMVFAFLAWSSGRANEPMSEPVAWRLIVAAGVLTALMNSLGLHIVRHRVLPEAVNLPSIMAYVVSGILGLTACLAVLSIAFRIRGRVMHLN